MTLGPNRLPSRCFAESDPSGTQTPENHREGNPSANRNTTSESACRLRIALEPNRRKEPRANNGRRPCSRGYSAGRHAPLPCRTFGKNAVCRAKRPATGNESSLPRKAGLRTPLRNRTVGKTRCAMRPPVADRYRCLSSRPPPRVPGKGDDAGIAHSATQADRRCQCPLGGRASIKGDRAVSCAIPAPPSLCRAERHRVRTGRPAADTAPKRRVRGFSGGKPLFRASFRRLQPDGPSRAIRRLRLVGRGFVAVNRLRGRFSHRYPTVAAPKEPAPCPGLPVVPGKPRPSHKAAASPSQPHR